MAFPHPKEGSERKEMNGVMKEDVFKGFYGRCGPKKGRGRL
jgi:hypothetical protein